MDIISRKQAQEQGLKHYFNGKPCKHGHIALRRAVNHRCSECERLQQKENQQRYLKQPEYQRKNRERANAYYWANHAQCREKMNAYGAQRLKEDPMTRIASSLRLRCRLALRSAAAPKSARFSKLFGCTGVRLARHLEKQFTNKMNWDNFGEWHVDHIRPCASFDLTDPAQQRACFFWANLQPLDAAENLAKGDAWTAEMEADWARMMRGYGYEGDLFLVFEQELTA